MGAGARASAGSRAKTIIERRYAGGNAELLRPYAEELVRLDVELIVTNGTAATIAAKNATTRIPIVMYSAGDPVRSGLVASLARPGGNITGYSIVARELDAKRLELLQELLPTAQRVAVLIDLTNPYNEIAREERERVYRSLGMQPIIVGAAAASELENAVSEAARRRAQALIVPNSAEAHEQFPRANTENDQRELDQDDLASLPSQHPPMLVNHGIRIRRR
jgi:ABC-type uncharacterized transport system substrate-binding protein